MSDPNRCRICKQPLKYSGTGRPPVHCPRHRRNGARDRARAEARARRLEAEIARQAVAESVPTTVALHPSLRSRALAVALALESDPLRAAALVGLNLSEAEIEEIVRDAKKHAGLREAKSADVGRLLHHVVALGALRLLDAVATGNYPPSQIANALKSVAQSLELMIGSAQPAYSQIVLRIEAPTENAYAASTLTKDGLLSVDSSEAPKPH